MKKITTKQITTTALLLAICIISQYFKNLSVYITGPVVNTTLILAVLGAGLYSGILLSVIAPITAFFFTGSPIMAAIPWMFPAVMAGNLVLVFFTYIFQNKITFRHHLEIGLILGSIAKAVFMGVLIVLIILPAFGDNIAAKLPKPEMLPKILATAKVTFSVTQLTTAMIGSVLALIIWIPLQKVLKNEIAES
ncbi:MAG: ECF transporter S component [Lachnospiraceae bacterium]|nr:ECF transporter S component [Lachnospiraceae bacterium]